MKAVLLLLLFYPLLLSSCDMFHYHPYEEVNGCASGLTQSNKHLIERQSRGKDTLRFAFISDTQRHYDDTRSAIDCINAMGNIDFMLHGGDLTDFGATDEFKWMYRELARLNIPYLTVIGNHDFLGTGEENYQMIYGDYNYSLYAGHLHLVCLNTASREQDFSLPMPDFKFLAEDVASVLNINQQYPDSITHTVVLMHLSPGDDLFNNNLAIPFQHYLTQYPGMRMADQYISTDDISRMKDHLSKNGKLTEEDQTVLLGTHSHGICLNGHNHSHRLSCPLEDKTLFFQVPDVHSRQLYVFTIHSKGYDYESIDF